MSLVGELWGGSAMRGSACLSHADATCSDERGSILPNFTSIPAAPLLLSDAMMSSTHPMFWDIAVPLVMTSAFSWIHGTAFSSSNMAIPLISRESPCDPATSSSSPSSFSSRTSATVRLIHAHPVFVPLRADTIARLRGCADPGASRPARDARRPLRFRAASQVRRSGGLLFIIRRGRPSEHRLPGEFSGGGASGAPPGFSRFGGGRGRLRLRGAARHGRAASSRRCRPTRPRRACALEDGGPAGRPACGKPVRFARPWAFPRQQGLLLWSSHVFASPKPCCRVCR